MKTLLAVLLVIGMSNAAAQTDRRDGNWISTGLEAFDRTAITQTATTQELVDVTSLIGFVSGILAVHRQNNSIALKSIAATSQNRRGTLSESEAVRLQTTLLFAPLLKLPDELSEQQIAAVLRKYLAQHPAKWGRPAEIIILDAFILAFPNN